jgi:ectoine hydroxylase-related dioxygenase (phytanoyl-CoA dioxygenase family)
MHKVNEIPSASYGVLQHSAARTTIECLAEQIRLLGYAVLDSGLPPETIAELSAAFNRIQEGYQKQYGLARLEQLNEQHTLRALLSHGEACFLKLALHPELLALISMLIQGQYLLNQQNGVVNPAQAEYNQGKWHRDLPYQHFLSSTPLAINALFCLDDFTLENGATAVLPATHKSAEFPSADFVAQQARTITAKAGSFIVLDCMMYHSGTRNRTQQARRAINHVYSIPFLKQQISLPKAMQHLEPTLSASEKKLLGFDCAEPHSIEGYFKGRKHG